MKNQSSVENSAIKALAAASKTPFKTAFKVTMGIAVAQLLTAFAVFLGFLIVISTLGYAVLHLLSK